MSTDDKPKGITETIAGEAKAVAVEVYKDAAKPAVAAAGGALGRLVRLALRPIELLAQGGERLMSAVERKLGAVPEDRLLPPPAPIAAPAALHYALLGDGDEVAELREMFENLLAASMDRETAPNAHPAFVSMISQLTQDEAWLLRSIDRDEYALVNVYDSDDENQRLLGARTRLGIGIGIDEARQHQYISNLDRLGILRVSVRTASDVAEYNALVAAIEVEFPSARATSTEESIEVTPFGRQFLDTCVRARGR